MPNRITISHPVDQPESDDLFEMRRAADNAAARLRTRGVNIGSADSPDDIVSILESVEDFERAVELAGGDLMIDEPPEGKTAEPDNQRFVLPLRNAGEAANRYIARLISATDDIQRGSHDS